MRRQRGGLLSTSKQRRQRFIRARAPPRMVALRGGAAAGRRDGTPHAQQRQQKRTAKLPQPQQQQTAGGDRKGEARRAWKVGAAYEGFCPLRVAGETAAAAAAARATAAAAATSPAAAATAAATTAAARTAVRLQGAAAVVSSCDFLAEAAVHAAPAAVHTTPAPAAAPGGAVTRAAAAATASAFPAAVAGAARLPMPQIVRLRVPDSFERFVPFRCSCCHTLRRQQDGQLPREDKQQRQPQPGHLQQLTQQQDQQSRRQQSQTPQQQQEQQESEPLKQLQQQAQHREQEQPQQEHEEGDGAAAVSSTLPCVCSRCFYFLHIMKRQPAIIVSPAATAWADSEHERADAARNASKAAEGEEQGTQEKKQSLRPTGGEVTRRHNTDEANCRAAADSSSHSSSKSSSSNNSSSSDSSALPGCNNSRREKDGVVDVRHLQRVWGDDHAFRKRAGELLVEVEMRQQAAAAFGHGVYRHMRFSHFLDQLQKGNTNLYLTTQAIPHGKCGPRRLCGPPLAGAAAADFPPLPLLFGRLQPYQYNIWCGAAASSSTGLHHDFHENLYVLLRGRKVFRLFSPRVAGLLPTKGRVAQVHMNGLIVYDENRRADGAHPVAVRRWRQQKLEAALASLQSRMDQVRAAENAEAGAAAAEKGRCSAAAPVAGASPAGAPAASAAAASPPPAADAALVGAAALFEAAVASAAVPAGLAAAPAPGGVDAAASGGASAPAAASDDSAAGKMTTQRQTTTEEREEMEEEEEEKEEGRAALRALQEQYDRLEQELDELLDADVADAAANADFLTTSSSSSEDEEEDADGKEEEETAGGGGKERRDASSPSSPACECDACCTAAAVLGEEGRAAAAAEHSLPVFLSSSAAKKQGRLVAAGELPDHFCLQNTPQRSAAAAVSLGSSRQPGCENTCDSVITPENILTNYWEVELRAGECLYLPAGWFHEVISFPHEAGAADPSFFTSALIAGEELRCAACGGAAEKERTEVCGLHMALNYWFHPPSRTCSAAAAPDICASEGVAEAAAAAATAARVAATTAVVDEGGAGAREVRAGEAREEEREKRIRQWAAFIDNPYEDSFWEEYTKPLLAAHEALRRKFVSSVATGGLSSRVAQKERGASSDMHPWGSQARRAYTGVQQQGHAEQRLQRQSQEEQGNVSEQQRQHVEKHEDEQMSCQQQNANQQQQEEHHYPRRKEELQQPQQENKQAFFSRSAQEQRAGSSELDEQVLKKGDIRSTDPNTNKSRRIATSLPVEECRREAPGCRENYRTMLKEKRLSRRSQKQLLMRAWSSHMFLRYANRRCMFYRVPPEFCYEFDAVNAAKDPPCFPPLPDN